MEHNDSIQSLERVHYSQLHAGTNRNLLHAMTDHKSTGRLMPAKSIEDNCRRPLRRLLTRRRTLEKSDSSVQMFGEQEDQLAPFSL